MKIINVILNQSLFDISIQQYGTIEGVFVLALQNDIALTDELEPGLQIEVPDFEGKNQNVIDYFSKHNIKPVTALTQEEANALLPNDNCNYCKLFE